jgi:hypothetical protein
MSKAPESHDMIGRERYNHLLSRYRELEFEYTKIVRRSKEKMQFSQKVCVFGLVLVTAAWFANYWLIWNGHEPMSDVTIAIITMFGGFATGGYFALSGIRDCSKNKHGASVE